MASPAPGRRRGGGVRFADDDDEPQSVAITLDDAAAVGAPLEQLLAAAAIDRTSVRASPNSNHRPSPSAPPDRAVTPGDLHIGGLQLLQDEMSHDEGYGHSRADSDADGPLDGPMPTGITDPAVAALRSSGDEGRPSSAPGLGGLGLAGHSTGGGHGAPGARRHHRAGPGRMGKGGGKSGKQAVMRTWLRIDKHGETSLMQADKWRITHKLGIQTRDLRLLDPALSTTYPSAILCRDKAIVVNLEHLKAIITTTFVLVVNPEDEKVVRFINELKGRLSSPATGGGNGMPQSRSFQALTDAERMKLAPGPSTLGLDLPFELKALEVCLDVMAGHLDFLTQELEASAYPALDALANKVSSPHLERVRRIKNNLVRLTTRVETVREVLEKFLDDDSDMHDLNLTAKELHEQEERRQLAEANNVDAHSTASTTGSRSSGSSSSASSDSSVEEAETAVVEMLLETYFMHVDNTYNKLQTLHEYIGDTEDLVNIKLDQHRNQLITIDLILTAFTTVLAMMTVVGAWFGMNLWSGLEEAPNVFMQVSVGSSVIGLGLLVGFVTWLWRAKLIIY
ncbi:hypothetical protein HYH03_006941 [Edaphochlamys debaryana]|uniref:Magnesium transporter n=1 Tax=Edaphochlamys debaryana TaxID=47281 RepID=A0A835Y5B5_9CHLO|nr:hypothetical protein HYH03_006941 [Edaphochlamys debaryana]|eukprot:KAG2495008.1 hypothetical protein HYH03_006941 [Edaphochlamys debaryana]